MGQKAHPIAVRIPLSKSWRSRWFARGKEFANHLVEDLKIRQKIIKLLGPGAGIAKVEIERRAQDCKILIHTSKPGILIGWQGKGIAELRKKLEQEFRKKIALNVMEIKQPDLEAQIVAASIGNQISRRISHRRAIRQAIEKTLSAGAKGIKIVVSGRLRGAEIARSEKYVQGLVPTSTFKNNIDFAVYHAPTTYGVVGVKVWIFKGKLVQE